MKERKEARLCTLIPQKIVERVVELNSITVIVDDVDMDESSVKLCDDKGEVCNRSIMAVLNGFGDVTNGKLGDYCILTTNGS